MAHFSSRCSCGAIRVTSLRGLMTALMLLTTLFTDAAVCFADDEADLLETVHAYFQSEKTGDVQKVWDLLAPSSEFKKTYSYSFYEEMVRRHPSVLKNYKIDGVLDIRENDNKRGLPNVEKIAVVQVTVTLAGEGSQDMTQVRVFTFLKEMGKWFKG